MEYVFLYLFIGLLFSQCYKIYFKDEPPVLEDVERKMTMLLTLLWLPVSSMIFLCVVAAALLDIGRQSFKILNKIRGFLAQRK